MATGALNLLKEKCTLASWRTSSKEENYKANTNKEQILTNGASHAFLGQNIANVEAKQVSSFEKEIKPGSNSKLDEISCPYYYDLYAVCNHHGTDLQGGHYTATCRNPTDGKWYSFDDVHTKAITKPEDEVISEDAYILFYQKCSTTCSNTTMVDGRSPPMYRKLKSPENKKIHIHNGKDMIDGPLGENHWVYRMPDFNYKGKTTTAKATQGNVVGSKQTSNGTEKSKTPTTATTASQNDSTTEVEKKDNACITETDSSDTASASNNIQSITSNDSQKDNFQRNSQGKYATLPTMPKRCLENDSPTNCDTTSSKFIRSSNQSFLSNGGAHQNSTFSKDEADSKSLTCKTTIIASPQVAIKVKQNPLKLEGRSDSELELDIDVQRPIDKNDVD